MYVHLGLLFKVPVAAPEFEGAMRGQTVFLCLRGQKSKNLFPFD